MRSTLILALILTLVGCGKIKPVADGGDDPGPDLPDAGDAGGDVDTDPVDAAGEADAEDDTPPACTTDEDCPPGELCRPDCFPGTGCGTAPASLVVDCPDEVTLPATASCSITLDGVAGQGGCIDCAAEIGPVAIARDDFGDTTGTCGMGSWTMVTGAVCVDRVDDGAPCTPGGGARTCCSDPATVTATVDGDCMLRTDARLNCSGEGDSREWRMERTLDTRGLTDIEVCFNTAHFGASDNEGILLYAEDGGHSEQVFCQMGPPGAGAPPDREWPRCVTLPAWAEDNPALVLRFVMHSHDDDDRLYVDDVVVRGWPSGCTASRTVAFEEDFDPCTSIIGDGWNGWTVTGSPDCRDLCSGGSPGAARATNETWSMSHSVDTSALARDVRLCFAAGEAFASTSSDRLQVEIDTGTGWQEAWYWEQGLSFGGACVDVCLNLSDIDPAAARNPVLQIRFTLQSSDTTRSMYIDDIVLDGALLCDGAGRASVGSASDGGGGSYTVTLTDDAGTPMGVELACSWDSPPSPVTGSDGASFLP